MEDADKSLEKLSEAEERFERARKRVGLFLAPLLFLIVLILPLDGLKPEAHRLAAVMAGVITLWMSEALPMPVTALMGASLCVILRVAMRRCAGALFR